MKTGTMGRVWVRLPPKPRPVADHYAYWIQPPPETSKRCEYWLKQIESGWLPNKHLRREGYDSSASWYGIYIWEYVNLVAPAIGSTMTSSTDTN